MTSPRETRIGREAADWVVKFDGVAFDARDVAAFRRWLARSEDHRAAFELASRTWHKLDLLARLEAFELPANDHAPMISRRALAAGAGVLAVGIGSYVALSGDNAEAFETGIGERREIALADGTRVLLNASSRIEARIREDRREARVTAGEALFSIAESGASVFSIATPSGEIQALSGEILVKLLPDGARVALLSDGARASRRTWTGQSSPVTAGANSEIMFGRADVAVDASTAEQLARRTLWREGMLAFDDTPLSEAVADVTRQSGVRFTFADPALADLRVGGLLRANDLEAFLDLLRDNLAVKAERRGDEIVLSSAATFDP
ncbi:iron siderophore sensor protein [alpha proteobacterium U9-1i]|nr:iron siderophore sensor protein [alpha proteobacterium U9-1i]